jgi:hypothetical protein
MRSIATRVRCCKTSPIRRRDIDAYADELRVLREDLRNPAFRARGKAWVNIVATALEKRFDGAPRGFGLQFAPSKPVDRCVRAHLSRFLETFMPRMG